MANRGEYLEAFFGVELYKKFEDTISDLKNIESDLKDLSHEVARLGGEMEKQDRIETARELRAYVYEAGQQVKDVRTFLDFYFTQSEEITQVILERDAYMLLHQIHQWDFNDVRDLRDWMHDFKHVCETLGFRIGDLINFEKLTPYPVPEDIKRYPVYAIDKHNYCLCGRGAEDIKYIDEIREELEARPKTLARDFQIPTARKE